MRCRLHLLPPCSRPLARAIDIEPGAITIPIPIAPPSFNAYINDTGYEELIGELVFGALAEIGPDGNYYPELATEVPTLENGGLSEDGLTVTWHLRPGLLWSDGQPFTARDVYFTWDSLRQSGIYAPGFDLIEEIEMPDEHTVILRYSNFYPNYRLQFGGEGTGIFPAHQCGNPAQMLFWDCNFEPVSIGPYVLAEWLPGQRIVFNRNPTYWIPDRPLTDQLIFVIEADKERRQRQLARNVYHLDLWTEEPELSKLEEDENVLVYPTVPARFVMRLVPNLSAYGTADPAQAHPIFTDLRVRQAILHALNLTELLDKVYNNRAIPINTELARHNCPVDTYPYNPEKAKRLLSEAGWVNEEGQGIRFCDGCEYAKKGTPLTFQSYHYAEFGDRMIKTHREIKIMLLEVGIDMQTSSAEGTELWKTWNERGIEVRGNFELNLWDDGYFGVDPTDYLYNLYDPRAIPTRNDPLAGLNIMRYRNPGLADIFDRLYTPLSNVERKAIICQIAVILSRDLPVMPLFSLPDYYALNRQLQGVSPHIYDTITWNAGDWQLITLP